MGVFFYEKNIKKTIDKQKKMDYNYKCNKS